MSGQSAHPAGVVEGCDSGEAGAGSRRVGVSSTVRRRGPSSRLRRRPEVPSSAGSASTSSSRSRPRRPREPGPRRAGPRSRRAGSRSVPASGSASTSRRRRVGDGRVDVPRRVELLPHDQRPQPTGLHLGPDRRTDARERRLRDVVEGDHRAGSRELAGQREVVGDVLVVVGTVHVEQSERLQAELAGVERRRRSHPDLRERRVETQVVGAELVDAGLLHLAAGAPQHALFVVLGLAEDVGDDEPLAVTLELSRAPPRSGPCRRRSPTDRPLPRRSAARRRRGGTSWRRAG